MSTTTKVSLISKMAQAFPKQNALLTKMENNTIPLNDLRSQIWENRAIYWYQKLTNYPKVYTAAKQEFIQLSFSIQSRYSSITEYCILLFSWEGDI